MKYSDKKTINDPVRQFPLGPTDATAPRGQTVNQDLETPVELMEFEHLRSRVAAPSGMKVYRASMTCVHAGQDRKGSSTYTWKLIGTGGSKKRMI